MRSGIRFAAVWAGAGALLAACQPVAPPGPTPPPTPAPTQRTVARPTAVVGPSVARHVSYSNLIADNLPEWLALETDIFKQNVNSILDNQFVQNAMDRPVGGP